MTIFNKVQLRDPIGFSGTNTQFGEILISKIMRLVGTQFSGTTVDTNFWTSTVANSATISQANNELTMLSGTNSAGSAKFASVRIARIIAGVSNGYRSVAQVDNIGIANNVRAWGIAWGASMPTITDGAYFKLSGTTFQVCTLKGGVETAVSSGSFNGASASYTMTTNAATYEIFFAQSSVNFVINNVLIHTVSASANTWANQLNLYAYAENINSGNTTSVNLEFRTKSIRRFGEEASTPTYRNITTATTTICKYSAGTLHNILIGNPSNNAITIYDNSAASGTIITTISPGSSSTPLSFDLHVPFQNGLTIVTAGTVNLTVIYE